MQWRECMLAMLDQLEGEMPLVEPAPPPDPDAPPEPPPPPPDPNDPNAHADPAPPVDPRGLPEFAVAYVKYLQIFRKLEEVYDQMCHPQKRRDVKRALEACMGRCLELKHWLVHLNGGVDAVHLDDVLVDLKLTPDDLEIPLPRYFVEDRRPELEQRAKFLDALLDKYENRRDWDPPRALPPPLSEEDAIRIIQVNERGRQGRARADAIRRKRLEQEMEDRAARRARKTEDEIAATLQAVARGYLARRRVRQMRDAELVFLGMKLDDSKRGDPATDPPLRERENAARRKDIQAERAAELDRAMTEMKRTVRETDGDDMRELIQDKINAWFVENRDPITGDYPNFPSDAKGGSKDILDPPPPPPPPEPEEDPKVKAAREKKEAAEKKKAEEKAKKEAEAAKKAGKKIEAPPPPPPVAPVKFVAPLHDAVGDHREGWAIPADFEAGNFEQRHDPAAVAEQIKPVVFEEIRKEVDVEMRALLENLKDMVKAERDAKKGGGGKKGKKGGGGKKEKKSGGGGKKKGGGGKKGGKKGKGKKDPTADRSIESLYAELVEAGVVTSLPPSASLDDFVGDASLIGAALERAGAVPLEPSLAQCRAAMMEHVVLPLGASAEVHRDLPAHVKAVALYGAPGTGKKTLARAAANACGAVFFDLSPRNTDGKYPGKSVSTLTHVVFKVAKTMAPSVIFVDDADKVFLADKKKMREVAPTNEPMNRIKKELVKEAKALRPGDRVVVVGCTREPQILAKKDKRAFLDFFQKRFATPLPDYGARRSVWRALIRRRGGGELDDAFDLGLLARLSEGYSQGAMDACARSVLTARRVERLSWGAREALRAREFVEALARVDRTAPEAVAELREWTAGLPEFDRFKPKPPEEPPAEDPKKKGR